MGFDAGDSNLYRYANNSPTVATDPSGLELLADSNTTRLMYFLKEMEQQYGLKYKVVTLPRALFGSMVLVDLGMNDADTLKKVAKANGQNGQQLINAASSTTTYSQASFLGGGSIDTVTSLSLDASGFGSARRAAFFDGYRGRQLNLMPNVPETIASYFDGIISGSNPNNTSAADRDNALKFISFVLHTAKTTPVRVESNACVNWAGRVLDIINTPPINDPHRAERLAAGRFGIQIQLQSWISPFGVPFTQHRLGHTAVKITFTATGSFFYIDQAWLGGRGSSNTRIFGEENLPWWYSENN